MKNDTVIARVRERQRIIERLIRFRENVSEGLAAEAHWNRTHPGQEPIHEFDHDGRLRRWADAIDALLASEAERSIPTFAHDIAKSPRRPQ